MLDLSKIISISNEPFEFGPIQTKWLEALESGNYKQSEGFLKSPKGYCCLGVLCEVMRLTSRTHAEGYEEFIAGDSVNDAYVPRSALDDTGLYAPAGDFRVTARLSGAVYTSLTGMNDCGVSFAKIAAYIRHDPHNVFIKAA